MSANAHAHTGGHTFLHVAKEAKGSILLSSPIRMQHCSGGAPFAVLWASLEAWRHRCVMVYGPTTLRREPNGRRATVNSPNPYSLSTHQPQEWQDQIPGWIGFVRSRPCGHTTGQNHLDAPTRRPHQLGTDGSGFLKPWHWRTKHMLEVRWR